MRSKVYVTVWCQSLYPSVCLSHRSTIVVAFGEFVQFVAGLHTKRRYRSIAGAGAQQQRRRATGLSSKCGQCRVDSRVDEAEHRLVFLLNVRCAFIHLQLIHLHLLRYDVCFQRRDIWRTDGELRPTSVILHSASDAHFNDVMVSINMNGSLLFTRCIIKKLPERISRLADCNFIIRMCVAVFINFYIARPAYCFIFMYTCGFTVVIKRMLCYVISLHRESKKQDT